MVSKHEFLIFFFIFFTDDSSDNVVDPSNTPEKPRKVSRNPRNWKRNKNKQAINTGQEYVNVSGKTVPSRKLGQGCKLTCRFKCHQKLSELQRQKIFKQYWAIGDHTRQLEFISKLIGVSKPLKHKAVSVKSQKEESVTYHFKVAGKLQKVCKTMFLGTLDISETPVRTVRKKLSEVTHEGEVHVISPDKRGLHSKINVAMKEKRDESVIEHIMSFNRIDSHYCRQRSKRQYLDPSLNRTKMWKMYLEWMEKNKPEEKTVSQKYYADIFNRKFNLGFHHPKKDQCDMCSVFNLASPEQKLKMQESYNLHLKNKEVAQGIKDTDKEFAKAHHETTCYAIFDLEKILETPKLGAGILYYSRKLNQYNFTVWDGIAKEGYCYTWHEGEGHKGANEVGTGVLNFIEVQVKAGKTCFLFWSDNCSSQNKNKYLFSMYTYASCKYNIKIVHRYLEKGHTHNEADNMHAAIERAARSKVIFEPQDWIDIIKKAAAKPYHVTPIGNDVLDFHPLADKHQTWKNVNAKWKQVREIVVDPAHPGKVFLKHDLTDDNSIEISITRRTPGRPINLKNFEFLKAYDGPLTLKKEKLKDLAKLCNEQIIPADRHTFYKSLQKFPELTNPDLVEEEEVVEPEEDIDPGLMWGDENDDETDYEEELETLKRTTAEKNVEVSEGESEDDSESENYSSDD